MDKVKKYFTKSDTDVIKVYNKQKGVTLDKYDVLYVKDSLTYDEMFSLISKDTAKVVFKMDKVSYERLVDTVNKHKYKYIDGYECEGAFLVYISK